MRLDHCLEILRLASMCQSDLSFTTFKWHPNKTKPMFDPIEPVHHCIDWNALIESTADRVVSDEEMMRMENPLMRQDKSA
jgi:hypothetical protein